MESEKQKGAPLPTIRRLPSYLRVLRRMQEQGREFISSTQMAEELKLEAIQIRKDLAVTGVEGKCRVGYQVPDLIDAIESFLGWDNLTDAFLVGAGSLGTALIGYQGFEHRGLNIVAAFDTDPYKIGRVIHGKDVFPLDKLPDLARRMHIHMAVITTPAAAAQAVADLLVSADIRAIWNFAPTKIHVPESVVVQNEDLSAGLAVLSVRLAEVLNRPESEQEA